jgi:plasmid stability protein
MLRCSTVRTTVRIDDELYRRLKTMAAREGRSVGEVMEDALRAFLARSDGRDRALSPLPVWTGSGVLAGVDLSTNAALRSTMDEDTALDALR